MATELGGSVFEITRDLIGDLFRAKNAGVTLTSIRDDAWLLQTPLWISSKMSLPSSQGMHFMSTPEVAPRL
jgi:hypothetical protein